MRIIVQLTDISVMDSVLPELVKFMEIETSSKIFPFIYGFTEESNIETIKQIPGVYKVFEDQGVVIQTNGVQPPATLINLKQIKEKINISKFNFTGKGVKIAVLDTGCDETHPALQGKVLSKYDVTNTGLKDEIGHGTAVASCIVSNPIETPYGPLEGIAPDANIVSIKVFDNEGKGYASWLLRGIEIAIEQNTDLINFSGGGGVGNGHSPTEQAVDVISDYGVLVCCAAGNDGTPNSIDDPGSSYKAISVGSMKYESGLSNFSSIGPTQDSRIKPDICLYGGNGYNEGIVCAVPIGSYIDGWYDGVQNGYEPVLGSSFSTPQITGYLACLIEAKGRKLKREEIEYLFMVSGSTSIKNNYMGWGIPDFERSINNLNTVGEITPIFYIKGSGIATATAIGAGLLGVGLVVYLARKQKL